MKVKVLLASILAAFMLLVFAQEQSANPVTVTVAESEQYGPYLTDAEGRTLYLFVNEEMESADPARMTEGVRSNAAPCADGCLQAWPPLTAEEVQTGEGVDEELLYAAEVDGMTMVVYNGWPLYYFAHDEEPGQINGQGVGRAPNIWYIVSPEGQIIRDDGNENSSNEGGG